MSQAIEARRSIRKFKPGIPVTREQVDKLLRAAMLAPSACNTRAWEFIAVTKRDTLDEIARVHPYAKMCSTAGAAIVIVARPQDQPGMPSGYFPQDCGAATQNILIEAVELGLGACWCGVYPKEERIAEMRTLFGIKEPSVPFCVIAVGVPDEEPKQRGHFDAGKVTYVE